MNAYAVISVVIVIVGALIGIIKREKIKQTAEIAKAGMESIAASLSDTDDTPGKITPAEWAEAIEVMAAKAKTIMKDA
jgi:hypothetical protein